MCLCIGADAVFRMTEGLQGIEVEVDVQGPFSLGRAALDHNVDLILKLDRT